MEWYRIEYGDNRSELIVGGDNEEIVTNVINRYHEKLDESLDLSDAEIKLFELAASLNYIKGYLHFEENPRGWPTRAVYQSSDGDIMVMDSSRDTVSNVEITPLQEIN